MSGSISFSTIPPNLRIPLVSVEFDSTQAGAGQPVQRALIIGDSVNSVPLAASYVPSIAWAQATYGMQAAVTQMIAAYMKNDPLGEVWAVGLSPHSGAVAATGSVALTGTASAAGTLALYIAGNSIPVAVAAGATAATVASAVAGAVTTAAAQLGVPVAATANAGTVTLTAATPGLQGNGIDIRLNYYGPKGGESTPAGLTVAVTPMAGGTTNPDISGLDAVLGDQGFDFIVCQYTDAASLTSQSALMSNTAGRWSPTRQVWGHVFTAVSDTVANLLAFGASVNEPHRTTFGLTGSPTPAWVQAAAYAGAIAPALRADPARPVQTLAVQGVLAPPTGSRFTRSQQQSLLSAGIALPAIGDDGSVAILRAVTNYQTNALGTPDIAYLDTETLYTLMAVTRRLTSAFGLKFARSKLADDGTRFGPGQPVVTPSIAKAELVAQYATMERDGLVEDAQAMAAATIVVRNSQDPSRLDILWAPYLVSGLRQIAIKNQFRLLSAAMLAAAA